LVANWRVAATVSAATRGKSLKKGARGSSCSGTCGAGSRADERYQKRIKDWKEMASVFLCDLYSLQQAADGISQRYFDGRQLLFPAHTRSLARLVEVVEELVAVFNKDFAKESVLETEPLPESLGEANRPRHIDIFALKEAVAPTARQHTAFLVDMARAETLDAVGENKAAVAIVDRHV
jgi:hypothetical protein